MVKVILSGGGTGGHIYPAVTIAREIQKLTDAEILFVGTPEGMESRLIPEEGFNFRSLPAAGLKRRLTFSNVKTLFEDMTSVWKAGKILREFKPDVVIGTGGYVCGPILLAAALKHIPTMIQEQNVIPGITNKILSHFVDRVALGYKEAAARFPVKEKCVYTGNPVRSTIMDSSREEARARLHIPQDVFMVLVAGGSRGARNINNAMLGVHHHFENDSDILIYHVTGTKEFARVKEALGNVRDDGTFGKCSRIVNYEYDMPGAMAAADVIIYRAGAVGLAEVAARKLPAILIPYPYAAEDHQTFNARVFVAAGAAKMIEDKYLTAEELIQDITFFKNNPEAVKRMSEAAGTLAHVSAANDIARMALELARAKRG